jgi:hypothetical protein
MRIVDVSGQSDNVLAPLSALQQLTSLKLGGVLRKVQLQHLQLPQLQQLEARFSLNLGFEADREEHLQLAHLAALTQLFLWVAAEGLGPADQLPLELQKLTLRHGPVGFIDDDSSCITSCSLQPLLALSRLQTLQLTMRDAAPAAEELAQLSSISSLTEVELWCDWERGHGDNSNRRTEAIEAAAEAAAAAWKLLPMTTLSWSSPCMPAADVQVVGVLQGLKRLELHTRHGNDGACTAGCSAAAADWAAAAYADERQSPRTTQL